MWTIVVSRCFQMSHTNDCLSPWIDWPIYEHVLRRFWTGTHMKYDLFPTHTTLGIAKALLAEMIKYYNPPLDIDDD